MVPLGDVDVVTHGFACAMTPQLSAGKHLAQVACGGGLGHASHFDVLLGVQSTDEATIAVVKQALQNFALAFVQWGVGMCFPEAPFEDGLVDDNAGRMASCSPLIGKPRHPVSDITPATLCLVERVVVRGA